MADSSVAFARGEDQRRQTAAAAADEAGHHHFGVVQVLRPRPPLEAYVAQASCRRRGRRQPVHQRVQPPQQGPPRQPRGPVLRAQARQPRALRRRRPAWRDRL